MSRGDRGVGPQLEPSGRDLPAEVQVEVAIVAEARVHLSHPVEIRPPDADQVLQGHHLRSGGRRECAPVGGVEPERTARPDGGVPHQAGGRLQDLEAELQAGLHEVHEPAGHPPRGGVVGLRLARPRHPDRRGGPEAPGSRGRGVPQADRRRRRPGPGRPPPPPAGRPRRRRRPDAARPPASRGRQDRCCGRRYRPGRDALGPPPDSDIPQHHAWSG